MTLGLGDSVLFFLAAVSIAGLFAIFVSESIACYNHDSTATQIESASLDGQMSGTFGMFGGSIDEEQYYFFYVDKGDGRILERAQADETVIVETEKRDPQYVQIYCQDDKLYVPEGTVVASYNVVQPGVNEGEAK